MEEEVGSASAPTPAPSDIWSLMLRVEALAKKAEAMCLAQGTESENSESSEQATTVQDEKKTGVAA